MTTITVPGNPTPKGRPRHTKGGHTYTPRQTREAEATIGWLYRQAQGEHHDGEVQVNIHYVMANRRRVDIDNLIKLTLDGLNGFAYKDDAQVVRIQATKEVGAEPCTRITVQDAQNTA